jgi:hypothetical protein
MVSSEASTSSTASALPKVQFCSVLIWVMISWLIIVSVRPPTSEGVMKKPSEETKTSRPAVAMPRPERWKKICQKAWAPVAPSVSAAMVRRRSIWFMIGIMVTTASGSIVCTMAKITVPRLKSSASPPGRPIFSRPAATMPLRPSSTSQAKFFTSALVQKGSSTNISMMRWRRPGMPDSQ